MTEPKKWTLVFLAILLLGLLSLAFEWLRDRVSGMVALAVVALLILLMALTIHPISAHDHHRPELDGWFKGLESRAKASCCDGTDATRLDDVDWESKDGRYRVRINGEWIDVPESAVVDGPNRAGPAMVWPVRGYMGLTIRCFMPGTMG